jgi:chemotaxis-related protein WspD
MTHPASPAATPDACWRSIGVAGDRSCAELARHVHCRNCPVMAGAARLNLQRPVEPGYREAAAEELARPRPQPTLTDAAAIVFRVGPEWLALPLALAASVAPLAPLQRLPHRHGERAALLGVVGVGGRLLPAVSLARLLGIGADEVAPPVGRHAFARLLVLADAPADSAAAGKGQSWALPVDEIHGVIRHARARMKPPAATVGQAPPPLVDGIIGDGAIEAGLLDAGLLMERLRGVLR